MIRILIDMNLSPSWVETFSVAGFESVHWSRVGDPRAPDHAIMKWAAEHGYIVFTHDLDFGALIAATQACAPSVIQVRAQDVLPAVLGPTIISAISRLGTELEAGSLVSIDPERARVRILPLRQP